MKITNQQFYNAFINAKRLMADDRGKPVLDKLSYACKRFTELNQQLAADIDNSLRDIEHRHCSTDDRGNILLDAVGRLMFTVEAEEKVKADKKELFAREIEVNPYICQDNTRVKTLHPDFELLNGLVFQYDFWEDVK